MSLPFIFDRWVPARDVAASLNSGWKSVYRLPQQGRPPALKVPGIYRFEKDYMLGGEK